MREKVFKICTAVEYISLQGRGKKYNTCPYSVCIVCIILSKSIKRINQSKDPLKKLFHAKEKSNRLKVSQRKLR